MNWNIVDSCGGSVSTSEENPMYCNKCAGIASIIIGVLVLSNAWFGIINWWYALGFLLLIFGVFGIVKPTCGCENGCGAPAVAKKKR